MAGLPGFRRGFAILNAVREWLDLPTRLPFALPFLMEGRGTTQLGALAITILCVICASLLVGALCVCVCVCVCVLYARRKEAADDGVHPLIYSLKCAYTLPIRAVEPLALQAWARQTVARCVLQNYCCTLLLEAKGHPTHFILDVFLAFRHSSATVLLVLLVLVVLVVLLVLLVPS